jgi:hypothetical protein
MLELPTLRENELASKKRCVKPSTITEDAINILARFRHSFRSAGSSLKKAQFH